MSAITRQEWDSYTNDEKYKYVTTLEKLISERERVLNTIPECPIHGAGCVPHAVEWVKRRVAAEKEEQP